jgi:hypothetical protein
MWWRSCTVEPVSERHAPNFTGVDDMLDALENTTSRLDAWDCFSLWDDDMRDGPHPDPAARPDEWWLTR